ncbi:hypothetical protein D9613_011084 [Agrocybe pediades]|uniref:F-box domain-containing protein n=1 Tax=Agrocybe pediades TaxID=84607 RepID=A0A8H4QKS5_9AGAR|nr:hypothetical protein D9613_011084 [Agrocybe pediades]
MTTFIEMESDPEIARLLQSNLPPNDATTLKLNTLLTELHNESAPMEAEILRLQGMIRDLEAKTAVAQHSIHRCHTILSVTRRVPDDIWHEIFYHCLPLRRGSTMHLTDAPLLLTRVCSNWRRLALSFPRLWSSFYIPLLLKEASNLPPQFVSPDYISSQQIPLERRQELRVRAIEEWLRRSGSCSLSISLSCPTSYVMEQFGGYCHDDDKFNISYIQQIYDILSPSATRWESVELLNFGHHMLQIFQAKFPSSTLVNLDNMKISVQSGGFLPTPAQTCAFLQSMPTLRKISLSHDAAWQCLLKPRYCPLKWYHFTEIHFHFVLTVNTVLEILSACGMLVSFAVMLGLEEGEVLPFCPNKHIVLPHLHTFVVDDWNEDPASIRMEFFEHISAPALRRFAYMAPSSGSQILANQDDGIRLSPLLGGSPSLETLSVDPSKIPISDFFKCISMTRHVRRIVLGHDPDFDKVPKGTPSQEARVPSVSYGRLDAFDLRSLAIPPIESSSSIAMEHSEILLPELEELVAYHILSDLTDEDLFTVIKSRLDAWKDGRVALLKQVKLEFFRMREKDICPDIIRYAEDLGIENGRLKIDLTYGERWEADIPLSRLYGLLGKDCSWPFHWYL